MSDLVEQTLKRLDSAVSPGDFDDLLWVAGDLIRKVSMRDFRSGVDWIDREEVTVADAEQLKLALVRSLERSSDLRLKGSVLSTLGCSFDRQYIELYRRVLAEHLEALKAYNGVVFAALIALDNLGEPVFERDPDGSSSQGLVHVEKSVRQAQDYLLTLGIVHPW